MDEYGFGSRGPGVQLLQLGLSRAGYQPGRIDGSFGRGTENALRQFQQAQGLPATGRSDAATWQAMMPWLIGTRFVQLRQGDTFWRLSQQYDTSVAAISAANPELDPRDLRPGQTVAIPLDFPVVPTGIAFTSQVLELTSPACCCATPTSAPAPSAAARGDCPSGRFPSGRVKPRSFTMPPTTPMNGSPPRCCWPSWRNTAWPCWMAIPSTATMPPSCSAAPPSPLSPWWTPMASISSPAT